MCDSVDLINIIFVLTAWGCVGNVIYFIVRYRLFERRMRTRNHRSFDRVAVIESVKGLHDGFHHHVDALLNQNHQCFRIIFCLSDNKDPAFLFLASYFRLDIKASASAYHISGPELSELNRGGSGLESVDIVLAGKADSCSQKIFNQQKAYERLLPGDRFVAWVDADVCLTRNWLAGLLYPLGEKSDAAVTGYRCLAPEKTDWPSAFTSVMNSSILTLLGDPWRNALWGGSMAMTRNVFDKFQIPAYVRQCFSDDESVAALLKKNHIPVYFSFAVLPSGKIRYNFKEMFNFGRRQYICARFYYKFHLFIAVVLLGGFTVTFFSLLTNIFQQPAGFDIFLFFAFITAVVVRGLIRFSFIRDSLGIGNYNIKCLVLETLGSPLAHLLHLIICLSALRGHTVTWAGITYQITGPFHVKVE
jgi:hypothetical protein